MSKKRIILSDSSLNRYGYRVLTSGLIIEAFKQNPVMLYMHFRDEGSPMWGNYKAIGHWEDIQIDGDQLSAIPVFDMVDDLSKEVAAKYEAGTFSAASVGIRIIATSANKELLLPGQTRETVTEAEVMEASIVDIPANANAVRLYDRSSSALLAAGVGTLSVPELPKPKPNVMKLNPKWKSFLSFLKVEDNKAETTELSLENMGKLDAEMSRLKVEAETKETEIKRLKSDLESKENEISQLKEQVKNLKNSPADSNSDLSPKNEPAGEDDMEELAAFCDKNAGNYNAVTERLKQEGLI